MNEVEQQNSAPITPDIATYDRLAQQPEAQPEPQAPQDELAALREENAKLREELKRLKDRRQRDREFRELDSAIRVLEIRRYLIQKKPRVWAQIVESMPWFS